MIVRSRIRKRTYVRSTERTPVAIAHVIPEELRGQVVKPLPNTAVEMVQVGDYSTEHGMLQVTSVSRQGGKVTVQLGDAGTVNRLAGRPFPVVRAVR